MNALMMRALLSQHNARIRTPTDKYLFVPGRRPHLGEVETGHIGSDLFPGVQHNVVERIVAAIGDMVHLAMIPVVIPRGRGPPTATRSGRSEMMTSMPNCSVTPWSIYRRRESAGLSISTWSASSSIILPENKLVEPINSAQKRLLGFS